MKESLLDKVKRNFGYVVGVVAFVLVGVYEVGTGVAIRMMMANAEAIGYIGMSIFGGLICAVNVWISYVANLGILNNVFSKKQLVNDKKAAIISICGAVVCVIVVLTGVFQIDWYCPLIIVGCILIVIGILALIVNNANVKMKE